MSGLQYCKYSTTADSAPGLLERQTRERAVVPGATPAVLADQRDDVIQIRRSNPQIYHRGRIFKAPTHLVGEHQLLLTNEAYTLYSTVDGEQSLYFPLPVRLASSARLVPLWKVYGARIKDAQPTWTQKRIDYQYLLLN